MFKAAGGWIFKHFFDDSAIFWELADHYNKDLYRFEFQDRRGEEQGHQAFGAARLRCGAGRGPQGLRGKAAQVQQIHPSTEELCGVPRYIKWVD